MKILAIDTASDACSVAAWDSVTIAERSQAMARGHAEVLIPLVETVLADAGWRVQQLELIAVTHGPGAFTGLRIGLAAARGLALALGLPCLGIGTLEAIGHAVRATAARQGGRPLLVAMPSKRKEFYAQAFDANGVPLTAPLAVSVQQMSRVLALKGEVDVVGESAAEIVMALRQAGVDARSVDGPRFPPAGAIAAIAAERWRDRKETDAPPMPLYLRPADTGPVRRAGRVA